jgi:hypothetical protein
MHAYLAKSTTRFTEILSITAAACISSPTSLLTHALVCHSMLDMVNDVHSSAGLEASPVA